MIDRRVTGDRPRGIDELLARARARLQRLEPESLEREQAAGALVVDIRPVEQRMRDGQLPGAIVIDRNVLEWRLDPGCEHHISEVSSHEARIVIVCNEGCSSSLAASTLHDLGLHRATDLIGGFQAWLDVQQERGRHCRPVHVVVTGGDGRLR
jgi:rhodanese-related sulfurtransferase